MPNLHSEEGQQILNNIKDDIDEEGERKNEPAKNSSTSDYDIDGLLNEAQGEANGERGESICMSERRMIQRFKKADEGRNKYGVGIPSKPTRNSNVKMRAATSPPSWSALDTSPDEHL